MTSSLTIAVQILNNFFQMFLLMHKNISWNSQIQSKLTQIFPILPSTKLHKLFQKWPPDLMLKIY